MNLVEIRNSISEKVARFVFEFDTENGKCMHVEEIPIEQEYLIYDHRLFSVSSGELKAPNPFKEIKEFYSYEGRNTFIVYYDNEEETKALVEIQNDKLSPVLEFIGYGIYHIDKFLSHATDTKKELALVVFRKEDCCGRYLEPYLLVDGIIYEVNIPVSYSCYFDLDDTERETLHIKDLSFPLLHYESRILGMEERRHAVVADLQVIRWRHGEAESPERHTVVLASCLGKFDAVSKNNILEFSPIWLNIY